MITFGRFCRALRLAMAIKASDEQEERERLEAKRLERDRREAEWQAELKRRAEALADTDGKRAAARQQRLEEQERDQLAFMEEMIRKRQAKLS